MERMKTDSGVVEERPDFGSKQVKQVFELEMGKK